MGVVQDVLGVSKPEITKLLSKTLIDPIALHPPESVTVTVYRPAALIVMDDVILPSLQLKVVNKLALITDKVAVCPGHNVFGPSKMGKSPLDNTSNVSVAEHPSAL